MHLLNIVREPVPPETYQLLRRAWGGLPLALRSPRQMLGRSSTGCGATIGVMPRCDFACSGCYLGDEANRADPLPLEAIKAQMRQLRSHLGDCGNLQLTDGEVTLRPVDEVVELLRYARSIGLIPMLMTLGISPDLTQAAYRVGDSTTNIITPLMPYFPLVVVYCQRYVKDTGIGTVTAMMLPYSVTFLLIWTIFLLLYTFIGLPLGIQSSYTYP